MRFCIAPGVQTLSTVTLTKKGNYDGEPLVIAVVGSINLGIGE